MVQIKKPCAYPACRKTVPLGTRFCEVHKARQAARDMERGSSAERGYGARWQRYRADYLKRHPRCVECGAPSNVVDHVEPHKGDMVKFWVTTNHQAVCTSCHNKKTAKFDGGFGR